MITSGDQVQGVSVRNFPVDRLFNYCWSHMMSYLCHLCKKLGVTDLVSEIQGVEHMYMYLEFKKLGHVIQPGLQGYVIKNIQDESMEASNPSHNL